MQALPFRFKPHVGESGHSFFLRLGYGYGLPLRHLMKSEGELKVPTNLLRPVRRKAALAGIELALLESSFSEEQLSAMYFSKRIKGFSKSEGTSAFFLDSRRSPRTRYCPRCLEAGTAFFKKDWLLLTSPICRVHNVMLRDKCHACGSEIRLSKIEGERSHSHLTALTLNYEEFLRYCPNCYIDISLSNAWRLDASLATFISTVSDEIASHPDGPNAYTSVRRFLGHCFSSSSVKNQLEGFMTKSCPRLTYIDQFSAEYVVASYKMILNLSSKLNQDGKKVAIGS